MSKKHPAITARVEPHQLDRVFDALHKGAVAKICLGEAHLQLFHEEPFSLERLSAARDQITEAIFIFAVIAELEEAIGEAANQGSDR